MFPYLELRLEGPFIPETCVIIRVLAILTTNPT